MLLRVPAGVDSPGLDRGFIQAEKARVIVVFEIAACKAEVVPGTGEKVCTDPVLVPVTIRQKVFSQQWVVLPVILTDYSGKMGIDQGHVSDVLGNIAIGTAEVKLQGSLAPAPERNTGQPCEFIRILTSW